MHLALGDVEFDLASLGKLADDVEQGVRRNGGRARLSTLAGTLSST
jgi:hypothetical protein